MSILSALKAKGAKGNNIEEAVKTLPMGGGDGGGNLILSETIEPIPDGSSVIHTLNVTFNDMVDAIQSGKLLVVPRHEYEERPDGLGEKYYLQIMNDEDGYYPFHVIESSQSGSEVGVGYYFMSPFFAGEGSYKLFYSATPDGPMTYSDGK